MAQTFTWRPDIGAERSVQSSVSPTKFGDGYEARITTGINVTPRSWALSFTTQLTPHKEILKFLEARKGVESFDWTDPLGDKARYKCTTWKSHQQNFGVFNVSATFEEVFEY